MAGAIVDQKLESLRRCVARIAARCPDAAAALAADLDAQDIVSLNLTRAIQLCVDTAAHRLAARPDTAAPQTMGETFTVAAVPRQHGLYFGSVRETCGSPSKKLSSRGAQRRGDPEDVAASAAAGLLRCARNDEGFGAATATKCLRPYVSRAEPFVS